MKLSKKSLSNMKQWVFDFVGRASPIQATSLAVTCWHIWEARNDARNGKGLLHPVHLAMKIRAYVENIVQHCFRPATAKRCESSSGWIPPPLGSGLCQCGCSYIFVRTPNGPGSCHSRSYRYSEVIL